jgi:hypothetical protein
MNPALVVNWLIRYRRETSRGGLGGLERSEGCWDILNITISAENQMGGIKTLLSKILIRQL